MENNKFSAGKPRMMSLDALRGFDMFWIIGGKGVFVALATLTGIPFLNSWALQLQHVEWHGFHFYDMVFPLFLFIAGVSFPFSFTYKYAEGAKRKKLYRDIVRRGLLLVLLGFIYSNAVRFDLSELRFGSVLGRIGLAWMFAALIYSNTLTISRVIWFWGLLLVYWAALVWFPATDLGSNDPFSVEGNLAGYVDRLLLPGKLVGGTFDPEGILSTIPAISTALLGMLTGEYLLHDFLREKPLKKLLWLVLAGVILIATGILWGEILPVNKVLWTGSFVCLAGGISILLFSVFYLIIDIWQYRKWAFFFIVIGVNSIAIYMAKKAIDFKYTANFGFQGVIELFPADWAPFLAALAYLLVAWGLLYFLYRNKIFFRV